jgi:tRNA(Ile)-lysidine synthetase-like protein
MSDRLFQAVKDYLNRINRELTINRLYCAVSGGIDSMVLLHILHSLKDDFRYDLAVLHLSHNIRSRDETASDWKMVRKVADSMDLQAIRGSIPAGKIADFKNEHRLSTEEAARYLRYDWFDEFLTDPQSYIALGHHGDDQIETVLMRILTGGGPTAMAGMAMVRDRYLRPFLKCERSQIAGYGRHHGVPWKEDSTNTDDTILRNRIRHQIIPVLEAGVPGFRTGIQSFIGRQVTAKKIIGDYFERYCIRRIKKEGPFFAIKYTDEVQRMDKSILAELLMYLLNKSSLETLGGHISYGFFLEAAGRLEKSKEQTVICGHGLRLQMADDCLFWDRDIVDIGKKGYLIAVDRIKRCVVHDLFSLAVCKTGASAGFAVSTASMPVFVRSRNKRDRILTAGGHKTLKKIMASWNIPGIYRDLIPVVEDAKGVQAVFGEPFGAENIFRLDKDSPKKHQWTIHINVNATDIEEQ